jgi:delta-aminolevulinic acid dehydratase/porphobilinogen synthase
MSRDVCGICWCPYDEEGRCGCENVKVINPAADDALLKQALYVIEAWERGCDKESYERDIDEAIDAIRARLTGDNLSPVANPTKKS